MSPSSPSEILVKIADYYTHKIEAYGNEPRGVDWNGEESQALRFEQLSRVISTHGEFSINDLGCGYGALFDYLRPRYELFSYVGYDISEAMLTSARLRHAKQTNVNYRQNALLDSMADYTVASGTFNVRLTESDIAWQQHFKDTLDSMNAHSTRGFAFNCLTLYSDRDRMAPHLFYSDPCEMFDFCKRRYSRNVALLHDYELYEYTIIVRK